MRRRSRLTGIRRVEMIRISITPEALDAIAATLPLGSVVLIWLDEQTVNRLGALHDPGESYSRVIIRMFVACRPGNPIVEL